MYPRIGSHLGNATAVPTADRSSSFHHTDSPPPPPPPPLPDSTSGLLRNRSIRSDQLDENHSVACSSGFTREP
ncbi:hypothetical protein EUGRSUZ_G00804 [Eucalyptus grandis]|uniref:Uncharacterized protein n=2 Tax=Eucalyptus grandis TaxID=71139 RepID=A0ACC3K235_EUCGR|nr:hypothetical protein EUGRSUZ_G00804 [Eucalyptus grandis]